MNGKHNIQIEINGEACHGFAYRTQDGILIHLPGLQSPHAPAFDALFRPLPEERPSGGFIEVGEWDGKAFPFQSDVLFGQGPDGAVWAKVCDHPDELPLAAGAPMNTALAWRILAEAEEAFGAKSAARQYAAEKRQPAPQSILDFLHYLEEEAEMQAGQPGAEPEEISERKAYIAALRELAQELRDLGFTPETPQGEIR